MTGKDIRIPILIYKNIHKFNSAISHQIMLKVVQRKKDNPLDDKGVGRESLSSVNLSEYYYWAGLGHLM